VHPARYLVPQLVELLPKVLGLDFGGRLQLPGQGRSHRAPRGPRERRDDLPILLALLLPDPELLAEAVLVLLLGPGLLLLAEVGVVGPGLVLVEVLLVPRVALVPLGARALPVRVLLRDRQAAPLRRLVRPPLPGVVLGLGWQPLLQPVPGQAPLGRAGLVGWLPLPCLLSLLPAQESLFSLVLPVPLLAGHFPVSALPTLKLILALILRFVFRLELSLIFSILVLGLEAGLLVVILFLVGQSGLPPRMGLWTFGRVLAMI
jgi:hypothetical protein